MATNAGSQEDQGATIAVILVTEQEDQEADTASTGKLEASKEDQDVDTAASGRLEERKEDQEAAFGYVEGEGIRVRGKGRMVWLIGGVYTKTNHYIKQSYDYVPRKMRSRLTCYLHLECGYFKWIFMAMIILALISPSHYVFAFIMGTISFLFFLIYAQHLYVVVVTVPIMLRLPHLPDHEMNLTNRLIEVTYERYCTMFAATPDALVAERATANSGPIKLHILSTRARNMIKCTRILSVLAFCVSFFLYCYCFGLGTLLVIQNTD